MRRTQPWDFCPLRDTIYCWPRVGWIFRAYLVLYSAVHYTVIGWMLWYAVENF